MGGAPSGQQNLANSQSNYYTTLTNESEAEYGAASTIQNDLTSVFAPIFAAGPDQEGFSAGELNTLNSEAATATGQDYQSVAQAEGTKEAGEGGGNEYVPQGANRQINAELGSAEAGQLATEQSQILQQDYATGRSNWEVAANGMMGAMSPYSASTAAASAANSGGSAASSTWGNIATEDNQWMGVLGSAFGATGAALSGTDLSQL